MAAAAALPCPGCRMRFSSRPLLHKHVERFCIGALTAPREAPGKEAASVVWQRRWGQGARGAGVAGSKGEWGRPRDARGPRDAPLGRVLTGRERALLRGARPGEPAARRPAEQEREQPRQAPGRTAPRQQELAEAHERRMAEIRARSQELERQREGLCRRLGELLSREAAVREPAGRGNGGSGALGTADGCGVGVPLGLDTLLPPAGPLAAEIRALRRAYLQGGGRQPAVLARLLELQVEATALERPHRPQPPPASAGALDVELLAVELENWRLEAELLRLKARRERRADAGSRQQAAELARLQAEVETLRRRTGPPRLPPPLPAAMPPRWSNTGSTRAPSRPLAPASFPLVPYTILEDPPPAQEPLDEPGPSHQ